jgi:hypothetical protein
MKQYLQKFSFLVLGLSLALAASYLNAWTGPTQTAPSGNVAAPVNLSGMSQIKLGGLGVASLLSTGSIGASQYCDASGGNCATPPLVGVGVGVPAGAIMAFNLTTCPSGWVPADGTNGTPDLRGSFIRGVGTNSDGTASGAFGVKQVDDFKSHSHTLNGGPMGIYFGGTNMANGYGRFDVSGAMSIGNTGGTETRPKNVALLYCQRI